MKPYLGSLLFIFPLMAVTDTFGKYALSLSIQVINNVRLGQAEIH